MTNSEDRKAKENPKRPSFLKVMQSVLAGAFGVQSNRRREEDFSSHSPLPYIAAGLLFTTGFVITLVLVVRWVLANH